MTAEIIRFPTRPDAPVVVVMPPSRERVREQEMTRLMKRLNRRHCRHAEKPQVRGFVNGFKILDGTLYAKVWRDMAFELVNARCLDPWPLSVP